MILFLTSDIGASKKVNGVRVVDKLNNTNNFIDNLQKYIKSGNNFVFIASSPNTHDITDAYARLTFESFNMSGFAFNNLLVIDGRTKEKVEEYITSADIVFLAGGNTYNQMKFFEDINLSKLLKKYKPIVIGQSAGALNLAAHVYCSPEDPDDLSAPRYFDGLGLTDINIEPHFKSSPHFGEWNILEKMLLEDSNKKPFFAITDGSYIIDDGEKRVLYGEGYLFKGGKITKVSDNGGRYTIK